MCNYFRPVGVNRTPLYIVWLFQSYRTGVNKAPSYIVWRFQTCREFLPHMISVNHGHIINVASMSAQRGVAYLTDYSWVNCENWHFHIVQKTDIFTLYRKLTFLLSEM